MHALILALALSAQSTSADEVVAKAFSGVPEGRPVAAAADSSGSKLFGWGLALVAVAAVTAMALKRKQQRSDTGYAVIAQNLSVSAKRSLMV
jgi:ABC-type Na+ efflux pump permease subunit